MVTDVSSLKADNERLHAAAILAGLTEREVSTLVDAHRVGTVQVLPGETPEAYCVTIPGNAPISLLAWAAAQSTPDAIVMFWNAIKWHACFADQRAHDELFVGIHESYAGAVVDLLTVSGRRAQFDLPVGAEPQAIYDILVARGLIDSMPSPYTLLALKDAWKGGQGND